MFKLDLSKVNEEYFLATKHQIAGEECTFVRLRKGMESKEWTEENVCFRSAIYNSEGSIISASYPKFFNLGEVPHIHPFGGDLKSCSLIEKIDGSTLIVSKYKGEWIIRTRGSLDAEKLMNNGNEIPYFKQKYFSFFASLPDTTKHSYIFEWVSPNNTIVIKYPEPELYLTNIICHEDYSLTRHQDLDKFAAAFEFKRPRKYRFNTLEELVKGVNEFTDREGVCVYYDNYQHIRKVKGSDYLRKHVFKSSYNIASLIGLYVDWGYPNKDAFESKIIKEFDYECLKISQDFIDVLYREGVSKLDQSLALVKKYVEDTKDLDQKSFAAKLKQDFDWKHQLVSIGFALRKGQEVPSKLIRDLLEEFIKISMLTNKVSYTKMVLLDNK